jgi:hypothetical protein
MIGYYGILLALVAATPGTEAGVQTPHAAASAADETGAAYRQIARSAIQEVLARREFADLHADPYAFWRMIGDWIDRFFERVDGFLKGLPPWLFWIVFVWMVLTLLAILGHLIYTLVMLLRGISSPLRSNPQSGRIAGELLGIKDLDFDTVLAEARRLLAAGDWPAATRYFYVAAILWLDRQGWIVFRRSKTNRDYIDELASRARIQGSFRQLTTAFEPIVYGGLAPQSSTIQGIAATVEGLLHESAVVSAS